MLDAGILSDDEPVELLAGELVIVNPPGPAVVRGRAEDYADHHPTGADTLLAVEIARTSQDVDRAKAGIYAGALVPVYWLLDLAARRLEVRTAPAADGQYASTTLLGPRDAAELPGTGARVAVARLLG